MNFENVIFREMETIIVDKRSFHRKLRAPKEKPPEPPPEMTAGEMAIAEKALEDTEKAIREAAKWLYNLSLAVKIPSQEQAEVLRPRVVQLRDEVDKMRSMFGS